ncbi:MAG: hypothetical protein AB4426_27425 [Xenococcaceae cyanobacterium]
MKAPHRRNRICYGWKETYGGLFVGRSRLSSRAVNVGAHRRAPNHLDDSTRETLGD